MALVQTTVTPIPFEPGEWMEIQELSWDDREEAKRARMFGSMQLVRQMGAEMLNAIRDVASGQTDTVAEVVDPWSVYDKMTVLRLGIKGWSYNAELQVSKLDDRTSEWAGRSALGLPTEDDGPLAFASDSPATSIENPPSVLTNG